MRNLLGKDFLRVLTFLPPLSEIFQPNRMEKKANQGSGLGWLYLDLGEGSVLPSQTGINPAGDGDYPKSK